MKRMRKMTGVSCAVVMGAVMMLVGVFWVLGWGSDAAEAANNVSKCIADSGAPDVVSVQRACNLCKTDTRGALWINGSGTNRNSSTIDIDASKGEGVVDMYLWGQVYSCGRTHTASNVASYIWIGRAGQMVGDGRNLPGAVSYVLNNNAQKSLYRGTGVGKMYTWYQPLGSTNLVMKLDVKAFKADPATVHTTEQDPKLGRVEVYRAKVSVNRCNNAMLGRYVNKSGTTGETCYGDDSEIVVRVAGGGPEPDPGQSSGEAEFYSTTSFHIDEMSGVYPMMEGESSNDGMMSGDGAGSAAWAEFTTDYEVETVPVKFWHNLTYVNRKSFAERDVVAQAGTDWSVSGGVSRSESGRWTVDSKTGEVRSEDLSVQTVDVKLKPGETKTVCQTISYNPKYVSFYTTGDHDGWGGHEVAHEYFDYGVRGAGSGSSQACVRITRPSLPEGEPWSNGVTAAKNMYEGETAELGWSNLSSSSSWSRRVVDMRSITYLVPASTAWSTGLVSGGTLSDSGHALTPCDYYSRKSGLGMVQCNTVDQRTMAWYQSNAYTASEVVAVPNLAGYKYCNSAGYFIEHWRMVCTKHGCYPVHDAWKDHWVVYNSACRAIAKKPTMAVWNSGVYVDGGVVTSTATRYTNQNSILPGSLFGALGQNEAALKESLVARLSEGAEARALFGSWAEYLVVATGQVSGMSSGAGVSRGGARGVMDIMDYSTLTIANNSSKLGGAIVQPNQTMRTRLESYLRDNQGVMHKGSVTELYGGVDGTVVVKATGSVRIEQNIVAAQEGYDSIYQIPKAVIFVDGDVTIAGDVERIDAWIIATGKVNTCGEFEEGTETTAVGYAGNVKCDKQLVFNGAVMASELELRRTHGADPETGAQRYTPAEVFNMSAENYLWAYAQAGRYGSSYAETYTRELAPRY